MITITDISTDAAGKSRRDQNRLAQAKWRERHPNQSSARCRNYHAEHAAAVRDRKRAYYQSVRKASDATPNGLAKDRDKKARRRTVTKTGTVSMAEWQTVVVAHDGRCAYCGLPDRPLEQDHVIALSKGGEHCASNIVPACKPCNSRKGNR